MRSQNHTVISKSRKKSTRIK